jgi:hypothetical protein
MDVYYQRRKKERERFPLALFMLAHCYVSLVEERVRLRM